MKVLLPSSVTGDTNVIPFESLDLVNGLLFAYSEKDLIGVVTYNDDEGFSLSDCSEDGPYYADYDTAEDLIAALYDDFPELNLEFVRTYKS